MKDLFPKIPDVLGDVSDADLQALIEEHEAAAKLIKADDPEFLEGLEADDILTQFKAGAEALTALRTEVDARVKAAEDFKTGIDEIAATIEPVAEAEENGNGEEEGEGEGAEEGEKEGEGETEGETEAVAEVVAEAEAATAEAAVETPVVEEPALVASTEPEPTTEQEKPRLRRLPPVTRERIVVNEPDNTLAFVASGYVANQPPGSKLRTRKEIAAAVAGVAKSLGRPAKRADGREERYLVASLNYGDQFPEERVLDGDFVRNSEKIAAVGSPFMGGPGVSALVASGGFCAPLTPIYTMPQLATNARPVRDALPNFRADRGGINVPTPTTMGDATDAITIIEADDDALGGTFATKSCLDMDCPDYTETAVTIISHCREFGNLNAMAWPEKIAHENELTMAEHARSAETYLLDRIKAQSVNVTSGVETLGALIYLVDAITKSSFGIRSRLRLPSEARFVALLPRVALDILVLDNIQTLDGNRFKSSGDLVAYLESVGIDVTWYIDSPSTGTSQIADSSQATGAIDAFPDNIQWALFPAGTFLHLDMAELNLGIVRDSTLNSTNDFQNFGESFENVARIGPEQAAYWETTDICANGMLAPAGTARTCD